MAVDLHLSCHVIFYVFAFITLLNVSFDSFENISDSFFCDDNFGSSISASRTNSILGSGCTLV